MSAFSLVRDVYYVRGAVGATLYDSRNGFLYHLDKEEVAFLSGVIDGKESFTTDSEGSILDLLHLNLVERKDSDWKGDIYTLSVDQTINFAWIEVTTGCNLRCIHCYEGASLLRKVDMPKATFYKIIDELTAIGVKRIQLIGGEPMVTPLLRPFLDYAVGKFDLIEIYTNGTLMTRNWVDYFKSNGIRVALSVYSYQPRSHDAVTREIGSWEKTNEAIRMLADAGVKYRVRNVLLKDVPIGSKCTELYSLSRNKDVVRMVGRANVRLLSAETIRKKLITKHSFSTPVKKQHVERFVSGNNCFATHLYFGVDGTIYPCVMERRISHGNINNAALETLLKREIRNLGKDCINECRDCEFCYFCFDCRPDSMEDDIFAKPWYCTYHPLTGEWEDPDEFIKKFLHKNESYL